MQNDVITIENAVVSYREDIALRGVSCRVGAGEFVGIVGPNGAGKTTLLTIVNGMGRLLNGQVRVLGHNVPSGNGHSLRKRVGYVPQVQNIDPRMPMNVREVVMIGRYGLLGLFARPDKHDWKVVDETLELVGMTHLARRPIGHLSGGEQQRVAIALALAQEPELFLLDEPTASLDWRAQSDILELVKMIHDTRHLTTLFVTHDLSCLPVACDRVILMKEGIIWREGQPTELLTNANLSQLYDMPVMAVEKRRAEAILA
jgi:ABC-type cobalamin/Fe3+-siderophores transport system ATPase subunit